MLRSQIEALEMPSDDEAVWQVDGCEAPGQIVDKILDRALKEWPQLGTPWWQRT
jgi:gluconate kinase